VRLDHPAIELAFGEMPFGPRVTGARAKTTQTPEGLNLDREAAVSNATAQTVLDVHKAVMMLPKRFWGGSRGDWLGVAMALKSLAASGYAKDANAIWHEFSAQDPSQYTHAEAQRVFDTCDPHTITFRSIFHWAKDARPHDAPTSPVDGSAFGQPYVFEDPTTIPLRQWVYGRHYARRFVSTTVAPGGMGKSVLALTEALCVATGRPLLGIEPKESGPVWYFNSEDPLEETRRRLAAICLRYQITADEINGKLFLGSGRDTDLIIATQDRNGVRITDTPQAVRDFITARGVIVAIIDPFVSTHRVSENDNGAIDAVVKQWNKIAETTGCAVELVHHVRKAQGASEITVEDQRGASALLAAVRAARALNPMSESEALRAGVSSEDRFSHVAVLSGKTTFSPRGRLATWLRFESVQLGNGGFEGGDSVGVLVPWQWPDPGADITAEQLAAVRDALSTEKFRSHPQAKEWAGFAIIKALGLPFPDHDKAGQALARARAAALLERWLGEGWLAKVDGKDAKRETVQFIHVVRDPLLVPDLET
jgi:hypothetical protein